MDDAAKGLASRGVQGLLAVAEQQHGDRGDVDDSALWYPVGILVALLAISVVLVFCCPGGWIG